MRPWPKTLMIAVLLLAGTGCRRESTESTLLATCERGSMTSEALEECRRAARLRAAYLTARSDRTADAESSARDAFAEILRVTAEPSTPAVVCKKNFVGGVFCARTVDVLALYDAAAVRTIAAELADASRRFGRALNEAVLIYCADGSVEAMDGVDLSPRAFSMGASENSGWARHAGIRAALVQEPVGSLEQERDVLTDIAGTACGGDPAGDSQPGGLELPPKQDAFATCMVEGESLDERDVMSGALQIAEAANACVHASLLGGTLGPDHPLARAFEDMTTLMEVAEKTAMFATVSEGSESQVKVEFSDESGEWELTYRPSDGSGSMQFPESAGNFVVHHADINGVAGGPVDNVSNEDDKLTIEFSDGSSIEVDKEKNTVTKSVGDPDPSHFTLCSALNPTLPAECEPLPSPPDCDPNDPECGPPLEPIPPSEDPRCAPDDPVCGCGAAVELAVLALRSAISGTPVGVDIANSFACCEDAYGESPLERPDPAGNFVCEDAAQNAAETVLECTRECSVFEWEGCMDWCLNPLPVDLPAKWLVDVCLHVSGLECPQMGGSGPDLPFDATGSRFSGWSLPELGDPFAEGASFNRVFANGRELFEGLLLRGDGPSGEP